ncbi:MAG TPA: glycoside hydrolase family 16 protein [Rectinemataceae bacterium]|nr:glycoside hydrolase family 16 protein [Rectinemataceae bacterium]
MNPGSTARRLLPAFFLLILVPATSHSQENPQPQTLTFSNYKWMVRQTTQPEGPMDNYFGGRDLSVFLNDDGSLTLKISPEEGVWHAGEVTSQKFMGYGTYVFKIRTPPADLDPNVVLGLFTYSRASAYSHREIDIEFSAWGQSGEPVLGQYVIQPYANPGHMMTFDISKIDGPATYSFTWLEGRIDFVSWEGYGSRPEDGSPSIISSWGFSDPKAVPKPSSQVHINLYLAHGDVPPSGRGSLAVTIDSFEFIPAKK